MLELVAISWTLIRILVNRLDGRLGKSRIGNRQSPFSRLRETPKGSGPRIVVSHGPRVKNQGAADCVQHSTVALNCPPATSN